MLRNVLYVSLILLSVGAVVVLANISSSKSLEYGRWWRPWIIGHGNSIPTVHDLNAYGATVEKLSKYVNFKTTVPVFIGNGPNASVGFGIATRYNRPSGKIGVMLEVYRPQHYIQGIRFSIKLFRINGDKIVLLKHLDNVGPYCNINFNLPSVQGVRYLLVVEAVLNDTVVDMIKSYIIVPIQYMDAALYTDKKTYRPEENLTYTVVNLGKDPIIFGPYGYKIYRWTPEGWVLDENLTPKNVRLVARIVYPNGKTSFTIRLGNATTGVYKLVIEVEGVTTGKRLNLETDFIIINRD